MKKGTLRSSAGFSLVELMVVVAIIGILAAMSVGQVQKQIAKARQSEAKTNLSALYTAEKAFNAEYAAYTTDFRAIGLGYEGQLRYNVGFSAAFAPPTSYTGGTAPTWISSKAYCAANAGSCTEIPSNGVTPPASTGTMPNATTFTADAQASIYNTTNDRWTITEGKIIANPTPGIP